MKQFLTADDVAKLTGVSLSKSYVFIRELNQELEKSGYMVVRGKVPRRYFLKRFHIEEAIDNAENAD